MLSYDRFFHKYFLVLSKRNVINEQQPEEKSLTNFNIFFVKKGQRLRFVNFLFVLKILLYNCTQVNFEYNCIENTVALISFNDFVYH